MTDQNFDGVPVLIPLSEYRTLLHESFRLREEHDRRLRAEGQRDESRHEAAILRKKVSQLEDLLPRPYTGPVPGSPRMPTMGIDYIGPNGLRGSDLIESEKGRTPHD